jgi:hypothetical protein
MEDVIEDLSVEMNSLVINEKQKRKKYGPDQIERFIHLLQEEGLSVPKAAEQCMIPRSSAYKLLDEYNAGDGAVLPGNTPKKLKAVPRTLYVLD